jgi:hypothetical protein
MINTTKWPGKLEQRGRVSMEYPDRLGRKGYRRF